MPDKAQLMHKILISGCLLGQRVRYNGEAKPLISELVTLWQQQGRLISICPEVIAGLPVPRSPAEIDQNSGKVITCEGDDVTEEFSQGAQQALNLCKKYNIEFALLKESSPSCGTNTIYDGTFSQVKLMGEGVTTKLLRQHGVKVYSEDSIVELAEQINGSDPTS